MNSGFSTYVMRDSFIHRFNPSLKLIMLVFFIVMIFLPLGFFGQLILFVVFIAG
jgi:energy-coupling factor transport system permease protein